ncbi:MAG: TIGR03118 family protein, partial [Proteobacteria bacterium]|nr:TIGR03118 family protein [Pseudomonadota bacterium]
MGFSDTGSFSGFGGGGGGGGSASSPATVTISVAPTTITLGQSATLTWSSNGTGCTASGAWSGSQSATGSTTVTPTAAGDQTYSLSCTGGIYSSGSGSATLTVNAASAFALTNLSADTAGAAKEVDAHLTNPWGLSIPAGSFFAWVANNHSESSTLYDGNGKAQPHAAPLVVDLPSGFDATGIVFNATATDFVVSAAGKSGGASFIFDGEGGMIAGWSADVDAGHAIAMYTDAGGASYKGLAIAINGGKQYLYATDFHNGKVDVFDAAFAKQTSSSTAFTFSDPAIPAGFAPFGIQALSTGSAGATQIYVTYAKQDS